MTPAVPLSLVAALSTTVSRDVVLCVCSMSWLYNAAPEPLGGVFVCALMMDGCESGGSGNGSGDGIGSKLSQGF